MAMSSEERRRRMHRAVGSADREGSARRPRRSGGSRPGAGEFPEWPDLTEQEDLSERSERTEWADRTERGGSAERSNWGERADRTERGESAERTERAERAGRSGFAEYAERADRAEQERMERRGGAGRGEERSEMRRRRAAGRRAGGAGGTGGTGGEDNGGGLDPRLIVMCAAVLVALLLLIFGIRALAKRGAAKAAASSAAAESASIEESIQASIEESVAAEPETAPANEVLERAAMLATQYDYDGAIELLKTETDYENNEEAQMAVAEYEEIKSTLVRQDIHEITHVFFHILMPDPANALDESKWGKQAGGYNSLMTTIPEFEKMLQEFYDKGYVLVRMHDMAHIEKQEDGTEKMVEGDIMLPPGKKGMVMSEDDVCYYEYMVGGGFADKMIIGEDGRPTTHIIKTDGTEDVGDYDLVPILDRFIDEHPDFSYKGAKAIIAFTGYNGILGYRTDETYEPGFDKNAVGYGSAMTPNPNIEADRKEAVRVLKALVEDGYELSSHSWGHRDMGQIDMKSFRTDTDRWDKNVNSLIKEATGENCDILIYPKGADIADWHGYSHSNERYDYLYKKGFRYFANVDSSQYWVQMGDDYLRQGRRALDGYNMWVDISMGKGRLKDLFDDVSAVFDPARPTPVPPY